MPSLTIGSACYRDLDSIFFTFIRIIDLLDRFPVFSNVDLVIVDNYGKDRDRDQLMKFCWENGINYRFESRVGPALAKEEIIKSSTKDWVLVLDSHMYLMDEALVALFGFVKDNPDFKGIIFGGIKSSFRGPTITHYEDLWHGEFWGKIVFGFDIFREPTEIWAAPNGLFAVRPDFWPGFNPNFRGYGGEEIYICEKARRKGGKCIHLPGFTAIHKFVRVTVPYPLAQINKVRNYLIAMDELGIPHDRIYRHFVLGLPEYDFYGRPTNPPLNKMSESLFRDIEKDPVSFPPILTEEVCNREDVKPEDCKERKER